MKKIDAFICGIASIFDYSNSISTNVFKRYQFTYEKNSKKLLRDTWITVGRTLEGAIIEYGSKSKNNE